MNRKEAEKLIGTRVQAWTAANGTYVGTLTGVIPAAKWRGTILITGVLAPAHHFEYGRGIVRRGFRPGQTIEVGGVNISPSDAEGTDYLSALTAATLRNEALAAAAPSSSPNLAALLVLNRVNRKIMAAEKKRLETGVWEQPCLEAAETAVCSAGHKESL